MELHQRRTKEKCAQACLEQPVQLFHRERPDRQVANHVSREVLDERRLGAPPGRAELGPENADRLSVESAKGEAEDAGRVRVEPLEVVHGHQHGAGGRQAPDDSQHRSGHRSLVDVGLTGVNPHQSQVQCPALHFGEAREDLFLDPFEEVRESGHRERHLRQDRPARKDTIGALPRDRSSVPQQRGLADPGLSKKDQHAEGGRGRLDETRDRLELVLPTDDVLRGGERSRPLHHRTRGHEPSRWQLGGSPSLPGRPSPFNEPIHHVQPLALVDDDPQGESKRVLVNR